MYQNYPTYQNYQPKTDDRIWVQSELAAESYLVAPNSFVRLWDSNLPCFYEKRTDVSGRPLPMEKYEYKKVTAAPVGGIEDQLKALEERIKALEGVGHEQSNADDTTIQPV